MRFSFLQSSPTNMYFYNPFTQLKTSDIIETSYDNLGGRGGRIGIIAISKSETLNFLSNLESMLNGSRDTSGQWWYGSCSGKYLLFDFGSQKLITESTWYQDSSFQHGIWQWQGSLDGEIFEDIGMPFILGESFDYIASGTYASVCNSISENKKKFRYYKMLGISGNVSGSPYLGEIEFKISI